MAIAEPGRNGEVRYVGEIDSSTEAVRELLGTVKSTHESKPRRNSRRRENWLSDTKLRLLGTGRT